MPNLEKAVTAAEISKWRSCLVQYKGGGYDGCIWEFNYAFLDPNGGFHNLLATGRNGCKTLGELVDHLVSLKAGDYYAPYLYQMTVPEQVNEFITASNDGAVVMVAKWLHENWPELELSAPCTECGVKFPLHLAEHDGYKGAGGLAIVMCGLVCPDCAVRALETDAPLYGNQLPTEPVHATSVDGDCAPVRAN